MQMCEEKCPIYEDCNAVKLVFGGLKRTGFEPTTLSQVHINLLYLLSTAVSQF